MLCKDGFEDDFWRIIWESIIFIAALHDGLSEANKQHYRLLLRNSEDIYKSAKHRKYNKATFRQYTLVPTKLFTWYAVTLNVHEK